MQFKGVRDFQARVRIEEAHPVGIFSRCRNFVDDFVDVHAYNKWLSFSWCFLSHGWETWATEGQCGSRILGWPLNLFKAVGGVLLNCWQKGHPKNLHPHHGSGCSKLCFLLIREPGLIYQPNRGALLPAWYAQFISSKTMSFNSHAWDI